MFIGIDPSLTGSGLSVVNDNYAILEVTKLSTPTVGVERLYHLQLKFLEFLKRHGSTAKFVCVEGAAYRETGKIFNLGQWAGIFYLDLYKWGIPFIEVTPLQLKKYVSGVGKNTGKETVILDVFKNFNEEIRDSDMADAYVLSRVARDFYYNKILNKEVESLKKYQREVLAKLEKTYNMNDELI